MPKLYPDWRKPTRPPAVLQAVLGLLLSLLTQLHAQAMEPPGQRLAGLLAERAAEGRPFAPALAAFYGSRDYRPLWFDGGVSNTASEQLLTVLERADGEGLASAAYAPAGLRRDCVAAMPADLPDCELRLSSSLLRYASDVGYGALHALEADPHWHIPQAQLDAVALLNRLAGTDQPAELFASLPPDHAQYRGLRDALAAYRSLPCEWFTVPDGPSLRPGDRHAQVLALRERLGVEQPEVLYAEEPEHYDTELQAAVEAFQDRHGLEVDAIVGPKTRAAMNVPLAERILQTRLNMERWRWLPRRLGDPHILVNLAGFDLTLFEEGEPPLRLRAISGRPDRTSPSFSSEIRQLVINPDWTVPRRLAVEDMLPQLQRDPHALVGKDIYVLRRQDGELVEVDPATVDWRTLHKDNFPYVLRQVPGPRNSLGQLKFVMPNRFDVFIHDTPAKGLFRKSVRTFSSGCIRVERPVELASRILGPDPEAITSHIWTRLADGATEVVPVAPWVPVYLVYLTAWVDEAGNLQFRDDVYGRDIPLRDRFSVQ